MTLALEHAGAERGLLILLRGDVPQVAAEARTDHKTVEVMRRQETVTPGEMPETMLRTVLRTRESVILDDAAAPNPFSADAYFRPKRVRSVLCLPLLKQAELIGLLYLENNLASHVFTPARIAVLELLASQAAISLENARLYTRSAPGEPRTADGRGGDAGERGALAQPVRKCSGRRRLGGGAWTLRRGEPGLLYDDRLFRGGTPAAFARGHYA